MCACIFQKKITIKEPFTLEIWAAKDLTFNYFLLWVWLCGDADMGKAALVNHTIRVEYGQQEMCCSWPATQSFE